MTQTLRLLAVPVGLLWALVACDGGGTSSFDSDTGDLGGTDTERTVGIQDTDPMGTQVGSEGFWGCDIDTTEPVTPGTWLPSLDGTPEELAPPRVGEWPLDLTDSATTGASTTGTLTLLDVGDYTWVDVKEGAGCADYLAFTVTASLGRGSDPSLDLVGIVAIRPDQGRVVLGADRNLAALQVAWGEPDFGTSDELDFRVDASLEPGLLQGKVSWVDCPDVTCPGVDVLATVTSVR